jgi:hypothetical protein
MRAHRPYVQWLLRPPYDPSRGAAQYNEAASIPFLTETLRRWAEIAKHGRQRFNGTLKQRNALWRDDRNFLRQALSNFDAALGVPNRTACLLYYYSMLNFAKSELMTTHSALLVNRRIGHGLSFNPTNAKKVSGDYLTVQDGIFPHLYEARTGFKLPRGTRLPVQRLMQAIPEIGTQVTDSGVAPARHLAGILQMLAWDERASWVLLCVEDNGELDSKSATAKHFRRYFDEVEGPPDWRDNFGLTRRWDRAVKFYESKSVIIRPSANTFLPGPTLALTWTLKPILGPRTDENFDAYLAPSLYKSRMMPMPPSVARYAITYYASSLVRYKPSMLDPALFPEQAYLLDAIARECALPMLVDVLRGITGQDQFFFSSGSMRT